MDMNMGDFLVSFTDGVLDARNHEGSSFTEERFLKYIQSPWTSLFSMIFELERELKNHMGGERQYDDITLLSIRRKLTPDRERHAICRTADIGILDELGDFVLQAAQQYELDQDCGLAFKSAMEKACETIIQHGYDDRTPGLLSLTFERDLNKARLIIRDDGQYLRSDQAVTVGWEDQQAGWQGMNSVKKLMDNVSYTRMNEKANELILEKEICSS